MISIDKLVQQVQQCKDTSITLPKINDSYFTQKNVYDIRKSELELLNNNFIHLNEANYTMDLELDKLNTTNTTESISENIKISNSNASINKELIQDSIPNKSLIIYVENEIAHIPEILIKMLPNNLFKPQEWYIYGVKNPESFYKSFLLLSKLDFIIKNKTEKKNDVATFKREMAMQYETLYKSLNYRKLRFTRNDMVSNLTNIDNYTEYDALQYISDYSKLNYIILDIITEKYIDIKYNKNIENDFDSSNDQNTDFLIIIKYASNTYLPLMNSNGKHGFNKSILDVISKHFERIIINKYKEPNCSNGDDEDIEVIVDDRVGDGEDMLKLTYNIEDVYNFNLDNLNNLEGAYGLKNSLPNQDTLINSSNSLVNVNDIIDIIDIVDIVDIEEQEEEPMGLNIVINNTYVKQFKTFDNPKQCNDIESLLSRIPMAIDNKPKKTKKQIALEEKLEKTASVKKNETVTKPIENKNSSDKEELKPLAKYNLVELQILAKLYKIDTQKMGNCDKKINKLKGELYEEIKTKM